MEEKGDNGVCEAEMRSKWSWCDSEEEVRRNEGSCAFLGSGGKVLESFWAWEANNKVDKDF